MGSTISGCDCPRLPSLSPSPSTCNTGTSVLFLSSYQSTSPRHFTPGSAGHLSLLPPAAAVGWALSLPWGSARSLLVRRLWPSRLLLLQSLFHLITVVTITSLSCRLQHWPLTVSHAYLVASLRTHLGLVWWPFSSSSNVWHTATQCEATCWNRVAIGRDMWHLRGLKKEKGGGEGLLYCLACAFYDLDWVKLVS
jgi:hypothetical protein